MNQATKDEYKTMTGNIRVKLADEAIVLQQIIDNPGDLSSQLGVYVTLCGDLIASLNAIDERIDNEPE